MTMEITYEDISVLAPDVPPKAQEMKGFKNPFISFESLDSLCQGNETLQECLREMVVYSLRYAETVCRFEQIVARGQEANEDNSRKEIEAVRGSVHDATMVTINVLIRAMKSAGKDTAWSSKMVAGGRAAYGKFAILTAFEVILGKEVYRG